MTSNILADQTPTPTRLIKNCEEVGLFEDLQNVNPFDETFRRACEQNVQNTPGSHSHTFNTDENSLHTPQVFPQFDTAIEGGIVAEEELSKQTLDTPIDLDVGTVEAILDVPSSRITYNKHKNAEACSIKYRAIAEKPTTENLQQNSGITILPSTVQFVQPQVITVTFPSSNTSEANLNATTTHPKKCTTKTKPLILPKLATTNITTTKDTVSFAQSTPSTASSASLTPTSQLPIKERLKAILNQSSKTRPADWSDKSLSSSKLTNKYPNMKSTMTHKLSKDDTMERRRAASTRYRHKIRNEYKELRKRNTELQTENEKLKEKIKHLEIENSKLKTASLQPVLSMS